MKDAPEKKALGSFRLCHWVGLLSIAFVLGLVVVWEQISIQRLGYMVGEAELERSRLTGEAETLWVDVERRMSPLALAKAVRELERR